MTDVYGVQPQFVLLTHTNERRRWFDAKTIFLITVVSIPVLIFTAIYMIVIHGSDSLLYPKAFLQVPPMWVTRAKTYSNHPKTHNHTITPTTFRPLDTPSDFKLVCYYNFPDDALNNLQPSQIDPFLCTHINVGFASVANNTINLSPAQNDTIGALTQLRTANQQLKILVSVGGAGNDQGFAEMVLNHANRKTFIHSVLETVKQSKIDGIDLDWEFPDQNPHGDHHQRMHFTQLLEEFRAAINRHKHQFLITLAAAAPVFLIDHSYDVSYINQFVDYVNIMTYDYHFYTKFTPFTGINAPLYATGKDAGYFSSYNINYTVTYWMYKGLDRDKIVIGLPTYGHSFRLTNIHNNGLYAPSRGYGKLGDSGFADFSQICQFMTLNNVTPMFNLESKSPYAVKAAEWISYDDEQSLSLKTEFVRDQLFAGVMVYSLNSDDHQGTCSRPHESPQRFPLTNKIKEILGQNYSIF